MKTNTDEETQFIIESHAAASPTPHTDRVSNNDAAQHAGATPAPLFKHIPLSLSLICSVEITETRHWSSTSSDNMKLSIVASALAAAALVSAAYAQDTPECEVCVKVMNDVNSVATEVAAKVGKKAHSKKVLFAAIEKVCEKNKKIGKFPSRVLLVPTGTSRRFLSRPSSQARKIRNYATL